MEPDPGKHFEPLLRRSMGVISLVENSSFCRYRQLVWSAMVGMGSVSVARMVRR
jgi:hypothetical protein